MKLRKGGQRAATFQNISSGNTSPGKLFLSVNARTVFVGYMKSYILLSPMLYHRQPSKRHKQTPYLLLSTLAAQDSHFFPVQQRRESVVAPVPVIIVNIERRQCSPSLLKRPVDAVNPC